MVFANELTGIYISARLYLKAKLLIPRLSLSFARYKKVFTKLLRANGPLRG